jgi:hypothetical protein
MDERILSFIIRALIRSRKLLGFELSHERGLFIDDTIFPAFATAFLPQAPPGNLDDYVLCLAQLVPSEIDAELVSAIFGCEPQEAENALGRVAQRIRSA